LLGPPAGRYLLRAVGARADADPTHVLVLANLAAPQRHLLGRRRKVLEAAPEPEPTAVQTARVTVIDVGDPLLSEPAAAAWLARAGEPELAADLEVLNRALHAFRLVLADPYVHEVRREQALVARIGYGAGEQVAQGHWTAARELVPGEPRPRRTRVLAPQARLAAILSGREQALACEELALRARLDLDAGREREAALQLLVALDAAVAELAADPAAPVLAERLDELRAQRDPVRAAAQSALAGPLAATERGVVDHVLGRIEAALRARAVANA
jgi:hypothetical protein